MKNMSLPPSKVLSYEVIFSHKWRVGYSPSKDEIFLWKKDFDGMCWFVRKSGLDGAGFKETIKWDNMIDFR